MADLIQFRRDTAARWSQYNPVLLQGELGFVTDTNNRYKIGDGVHAWNSLTLQGFSGNVVDDLGDNYGSVISQGGLTLLLKRIINNGVNIDIVTNGWTILDDLNSSDKIGLYALNCANSSTYHMFVSGCTTGDIINQFIIGSLTIDSDGALRGNNIEGKFNIICRTYNISSSTLAAGTNVSAIDKGNWGLWKYIQQDFLKGESGTSIADGITQKYFTETVKTLNDLMSSDYQALQSYINNQISETNSTVSVLQDKFQNLNTRADDIEDIANTANTNATQALKDIDTNKELLLNTNIARFDGVLTALEANSSISETSHAVADGTVFFLNTESNKYFVYRVVNTTDSSIIYYRNWIDENRDVNNYLNSSDLSVRFDKIYTYNGCLYMFTANHSFINITDLVQAGIDVLNTKTNGIIEITGIISATDTPDIDGLYLRKDSKDKIRTLYKVYKGDGITVAPVVGKFYHYTTEGTYYGYDGKSINLIGGGSGSGSGSGFYDVTKEIPLDTGYYTLTTAIAALVNGDIEDDDKMGKIITFEVASGDYEDYRFIGTDISSFYEISAWEPYGGKGAVKQITLTLGNNTPQVVDPDGNGNATLNIPITEVDETIDSNSTNPVQNKAVAAKFNEFSGKYAAGIQLNTIDDGSGNKVFSMSLLDENGNVLQTSDQFSGGGGGTTSTTKIVLTRLTSNPTVKSGDTVKLSYKYDQVDTSTGESTGNSAEITYTVTRGATTNTWSETVSAGATSEIDVTKYLGVGTNSIKVRAVVGTGDEQQVTSITWNVTVVQLTLTSSFNIATIINKGDAVSIPYGLTGSGTKTLRCYVDGVDKEDRTITSSSANGSFSIDTSSMTHGSHSVQLVAELELTGGTTIKSNSIYFDMGVRVSGNSAPIFSSRFDFQDGTIISSGDVPYIPVQQYDNYKLVYAIYNPKETPTSVEVYENGTLQSSTKVAFITTTLEVRAMNYGTENCYMICGTKKYNFNLVITKSDLDLTEPTDNMTLKLSAQGRSNNDTNKTEWSYGDITSTFTDFNWGGDGWTGTVLRHKGKARTTVNFKPLAQPTQNANDALAYMIKYKATDVVDESTAIISCLDSNGTGFVITPTEARIITRGNSKVALNMATDNIYEVGFVSFPISSDQSSDYEKENTQMVYLYINGEIVGGVQRGTSDSIYQAIPAYITIGSDDATTDVYLMRAYSSFLTDAQMLSCFILDQETADELLSKYNENDILDASGGISVDSAPDGMRVVIITGKQTNGVATVLQAAITNNKSKKYDVDEILTFIKNGSANENFRLIGGCISLQGTSSLAYPIKNYRIYLYNSSKVNGRLYLGCSESGSGGTLQTNVKFSFRLSDGTSYAAAPVACWCTKADYAESSSSHNTGMARLVNSTLVSVGDLVPPQAHVDRTQYTYDVRTTVDGEPALFFYRCTVNDTPTFLGKYNWNNDKSTEVVFGFKDIPGYHDQEWVNTKFSGVNPTECWEFLNNDYAMGMFKDADFDAKETDGTPSWMKVFEARFPDDDDINAQYEAGTKKPTYLEALVKWVNSTDTLADGLTATEKTERGKKFADEIENYFDLDYLCDYYEFTEIFACVDQRVKNMMMGFWYNPDKDKMLAYMIFYDCDTILGVRNDGRLKYSWDVNWQTKDTELSTDEKTVYAYAGHDSVLWYNLREQFGDKLKSAYIRLRAKLGNDDIFDFFDTQQSDKFCERVYNIDALNKYVIPKTIGVEVLNDGVTTNQKYSYLEAMQGSRTAHRHWFVLNRTGLFDAWASTGQYTATDISFKGNSASGATIKATAAREFYFEFRREGETMTHDAVSADVEWSYTYNQTANIGTIFHLLGGTWMKSLDVSSWGGFTDFQLPTLPVLEELIMGKSAKTYELTELSIGSSLPMIKKLVLINYTNLPNMDLSSCLKIEYLDISGCAAMSTVTFAESAPLNYLHMPLNYKTLNLKSLPNITRDGLVFDNIKSITGIWIENCSQLDGFALFEELFALTNSSIKYVRLTDQVLEGDGSNLTAWYEAGLGGIDSQGSQDTSHCLIGGTYQLTSYLDEDIYTKYVAYFPELNIKQPQYTKIGIDESIADDTDVSNYDNSTGYEYGNSYVVSGHVKKILSNRHGYLGKQVNDGVMTICQLNDENFNYYADGNTVKNSTPAVLDSTEGDAFILEPHYWYKGINDVINKKKYACFSSNEEQPDTPSYVSKFTLDDIKATAGAYKTGYKVLTGKATLSSALSADSSYNTIKLTGITGIGKVRFPTVLGTSLVGAVFVDADGNVVQDVLVGTLDSNLVNGMYVIVDIPSTAVELDFSMQINEEFDYVLLSNATKIEDMELDWVEHTECLVGMFEAINIGSKIYSASNGVVGIGNLSQADFSNYASQRKLQLVDWEMHKDVGNLHIMKYGRRDMQAQCGYGQNTNQRVVGTTSFMGLAKDTINPNNATEYCWYYNDVQTLTQIASSHSLGYENWWGNLSEWMDKVALPNSTSADTYKYHITMPDSSVRKVLSISTSGNYVKYMYWQKYMDLINVGNQGGDSTHYYADTQWINNSTNRAVYRSNNNANANGGVSCADANNDSSYADAYIGCRLAFRGPLLVVVSVSAYKALSAKY